jgi:hypothetical protein
VVSCHRASTPARDLREVRQSYPRRCLMNNIIYMVGLVVIVLAILGWLGWR